MPCGALRASPRKLNQGMLATSHATTDEKAQLNDAPLGAPHLPEEQRPMDLSAIPILDHHCHPLRRFGAPLAAEEFRRFFSESTDSAMPAHIRRTVFYMRMIRDLARALGCAEDEQALLE